MKRTIRLTESDLHRIVAESVRRLIREHDPDEPDYGPYGDMYGDMYDAYSVIRQYENESAIEMYFIPSKSQLVFDEPDEEGELNEYYYTIIIIPKLNPIDEYGLELEDLDYAFDVGSNTQYRRQLEEQYGTIISKQIDDNFDAIYKEIKQHSGYTIY